MKTKKVLLGLVLAVAAAVSLAVFLAVSMVSSPGESHAQPAPDVHYYCHIAPGGDPEIAVNLETQFGWEYGVDVGPGELLCTPAIKTRAGQPPEGTLDAPHIRSFLIDEYLPAPIYVNLTTQFGTYENVLVEHASRLILPVSKEVIEPVYLPPTPLYPEPHYKCYDIQAPGPDETVTLETQFLPPGTPVYVGDAIGLCLPAGKNGAPVPDWPHGVCYSAYVPGQFALVNLITQFLDDIGFAETGVWVYDGVTLCVPATKEVVEQRQRPTFSIEDFGPSTQNGGGPFDPADILYNPGAPAVCIPCPNLGLTGCTPIPGSAYDDMDALSYGADFGTYSSQDGYLGFSVDEGSQGQPGTAVNVEAMCVPPEPEADEFTTPLDGTNTQYFDGDGVACGTNSGAPLGLVEIPPTGDTPDDLDALGELDCPQVDWTDPAGGPPDGIADREVYFSLTPGSPTLTWPMPLGTPADILVTTVFGAILVYAPEAQLGLQPGDDVNGLCLAETSWPPGNPDREWFDPDALPGLGKDYLFFTLEASSPTVTMGMADASDILYVPSSGTFVIVDEETALGLIPSDDVDAIKCIKGLVDISIDDYFITLPDGTVVREGDPLTYPTQTVSQWYDYSMTEVKHYYGVEEELSPPSVTSQVGWAVLPPPLPGVLNVRFNAQPGDICTDGTGAPVPCGEGGVAGVPWDPTTLPNPPPAGVDSCKDGIDNDGDGPIDFADPDCVDIYDVHFNVDLDWCVDRDVDRQVQVHCKEPGEFTITFVNIELPLGADDIDPESNEGYIDVTIICEEAATPTATPTDTPVPPTPTATSTPMPAYQDPTFSIARGGPSVPPIDPADLLIRSPGGAWPPTAVYPCPAFALMFCGGPDEVNAVSSGRDFTLPKPDPANPSAHLFFSVAPGSVGLAGTGVNAETVGCLPEPEADEFGSAATGGNYQFFDGDGVAACANPPAPALGLVEPPIAGISDDLDALDPLNLGPAPGPIYGSLDQASWSLGFWPWFPTSAADIFFDPGMGIVGLYAPALALGLDIFGPNTDDIDALCINDADGDNVFSAADTVWFSLAAGSASLTIAGDSAADVFAAPFMPGAPVVAGGSLGLMALPPGPIGDDLNALKCYSQCVPPFTDLGLANPDSDCDGAPDIDELSAAPNTCGTRNPNDRWDFYDVPVPTIHVGGDMNNRDSAVTLFNDVLGVLEYSGALEGGPPNGGGRDYDDDFDGDTIKDGVAYDREVGAPWPELGPGKFHTTGPASPGGVTLFVDVLLVLDQSGHICPSA